LLKRESKLLLLLICLQIKTNKPEAQKTILFDLNQSAAAANEIQVNSPIQVVPMTELNETGIVRYSLEEYMEVENDLLNSKPVLAKVEESVQEELNITMKNVEPVTEKFSTSHEEINPLEMTIEETLKFRADERRKKLKDFNYKFHNNSNRIEELEKEPAFKRSGVDISTNPMSNNTSRISLGTDSNDDIQLRSNNSFLHDNVD